MPEFAVPIMPSKDLDATLAFYERLGFENAGSAPSDFNYLIIRRGGVQLHFYGDPDVDPLTTSSSCYVFVDDADAVYDAWKRHRNPNRSEHRKSAAGTRRYRLRDAGVRAGRSKRQSRPRRFSSIRLNVVAPPCQLIRRG
jgi:catechol 2,3-dioxygenase-like lactoylglutathione lyase family enzyme